MTCGLISSFSSFLFSLNKNKANSPVATSTLATREMEEELVGLLKDHHLQHRRESFDIMGIKTHHDFATTKRLSLKENHMFTEAELHHFDNLRDVCIKRYNEQKQQPVPPLAIKPSPKPIVTETGADRKSVDEHVPLGANPYPQPPASIDPRPSTHVPNLDTNVGQIPYYPPAHQQESYMSYPQQTSLNYPSGNYQFQSVNEQPNAMPSMSPHHQMVSIPPIQQPYSVPDIYRQHYNTMPSQPPPQNQLYHQRFYPQQYPTYHDSTNPGPPKGDHMPYNPINNLDIDKYYELDDSKEERGLGFIFINETFEKHPDGKREGAKQDEINFEHIYKMMGLKVDTFYNAKTDYIIQKLKDVSQQDLTQCQMLCVGFSTHGEQGDHLLGSDTKFSLYRDVVSLFKPDKCPSLSGKPKVFLVQACRGKNEVVCDSIVSPNPYTLESDFLIAHSVVSGYQAFRHVEKGSWFVSQLEKAFVKYSTDFHFVDILTFANQLVVKLSKETGKEGAYTQTCQFESTLTKILKINPRFPVSQRK